MPLSRRGRIRIALLSVLALLLYLGVCTSFERTRIRRQAAAVVVATHAIRHVDRTTLLKDLRALGDPALQGRRTGTPGGLRARALIAAQMAAAGLAPLAADRIEPFRFVHTSVKGLFIPGRPFRTAYDDAANVIGRRMGSGGGRQFVVSA